MDSAKILIRSCLQGAGNDGILANKFLGFFQELTGEKLNFGSLGFSSVDELIRNIPDVATVRKNSFGATTYYFLPDASTANLCSLIAKQRTRKKGKGSRGRGGRRPLISSRPSTFRPPTYQYHRPAPITPVRRAILPSSRPVVHRQPPVNPPVQKAPQRGSNNVYVPPHRVKSVVGAVKGPMFNSQLPPRLQKQDQHDVPPPKRNDELKNVSQILRCHPRGIYQHLLLSNYIEQFGRPLSYSTVSQLHHRKDICSVEAGLPQADGLASKIYFPAEPEIPVIDLTITSPCFVSSEQDKTEPEIPLSRLTITRAVSVLPEPSLMQVGFIDKVMLSHYEDMTEFYVQSVASLPDFETFLIKERGNFSKLGELTYNDLYERQSVAVQFSSDGNWYRGRVLKVDEDSANIQFVDYGNWESVPHYKERIRQLPESAAKKAPFAIPCAFVDSAYFSHENTEEEARRIMMREGPAEYFMKVVKIVDDRCHVEIYAEDPRLAESVPMSLNDHLSLSFLSDTSISLDDVVPPPTLTIQDQQGDECPVFDFIPEAFINTSMIYGRIVIENSEIELTNFANSMSVFYDKFASSGEIGSVTERHVSHSHERGDIYCLKLNRLGGWARVSARILPKTFPDELTQVEYSCVDYGDIGITYIQQLKPLLAKFRRLPKQAVHVCLDGLENLALNEELHEKVSDLIVKETDEMLLAKFVDKTRHHPFPVELYDIAPDDNEAVNLNDQIRRWIEQYTVISAPELPSKFGEVTDCWLLNVADDGVVYLRLPGVGVQRLTQLEKEMYSYFSNKTISSADLLCDCKEGDRFIAVTEDPLRYYRATVQKIDDEDPDKVTGFLIDYGVPLQLDTLARLKLVDKFAVNLPPQAVECALAGLEPEGGLWAPDIAGTVLEYFSNLSERLSAEVVRLGTGKQLTSIKLYNSEEELLNPDLIALVEASNPLARPSSGASLHSLGKAESKENRPPVDPQLLPASVPPTMPPGLPLPPLPGHLPLPPLPGNLPLQLPPLPTGMAFPSQPFNQCLPVHPPPGFLSIPISKPPAMDTLKTGALPPPGDWCYAKVTSVKDPSDFQVVIIQNEATSRWLQQTLHEYCTALSTATVPLSVKQNDIYAIRFENSWHRVMVLIKLPHDKVHVTFVDLGYTSDVLRTDLRQIPPEFLEIPFKCVSAGLANVVPFDGDHFSQESVDAFKELCFKKKLVLFRTGPDEKSVRLIDTSCYQFLDNVIDHRLCVKGFLKHQVFTAC